MTDSFPPSPSSSSSECFDLENLRADELSFNSLFGDESPGSPMSTTGSEDMMVDETKATPPTTTTTEEADKSDEAPASEKKPTKKRKSWGQELPTPKTNLPPRKRAKTADEKEQRRIERVLRNRAAAHSSRERKRKEQEELESTKNRLEVDNANLKQQLMNISTDVEKLQKQYRHLLENYNALRLRSPQHQEEFPEPEQPDFMKSSSGNVNLADIIPTFLATPPPSLCGSEDSPSPRTPESSGTTQHHAVSAGGDPIVLGESELAIYNHLFSQVDYLIHEPIESIINGEDSLMESGLINQDKTLFHLSFPTTTKDLNTVGSSQPQPSQTTSLKQEDLFNFSWNDLSDVTNLSFDSFFDLDNMDGTPADKVGSQDLMVLEAPPKVDANPNGKKVTFATPISDASS